MKYCKQHNELEPCPICRGARTAALAQEAREFALAYDIVSPEHQQRFAKDAVALIRRLAAVLPQEAGAPPDWTDAQLGRLFAALNAGSDFTEGRRVLAQLVGSRAPSEAAPREALEWMSDAARRFATHLLMSADNATSRQHQADCTAAARTIDELIRAIDGLSGSPSFREAPPEEQSSQ